MAQHTPQPAQQRGFVYIFTRSTWITASWNWFLMLAGKAAEPVLTMSVIYSCARLLPAVHLPVALDNAVFICQMVALDVGGLGLRKLAQQAQRDGNEEGAKLAGSVSTALIGIMCVNVGLSVLQSIAHLPGEFIAVTEGVLLIARAVLAVLYSFVIHSLHNEAEQDGQRHDVQGLIDQALTEQAERFDRTLTEQSVRFDQALRVQSDEHQQEIARLTKHFSEQVARAVQSPAERLNRQLNTREEHQGDHQAEQRPGPRLLALPSVSPLERRDDETLQAFISRLLDQDQTRGPRELGRLAGCSPASAKTYRDLYTEHLNTRTERNGTDD